MIRVHLTRVDRLKFGVLVSRHENVQTISGNAAKYSTMTTPARICDRAYIIHEGKNLRDSDPKTIINDPVVREAYLASTFRGDEFD